MSAAVPPKTVLVLLCPEVALNLTEVEAGLRKREPRVHVEIVPHLEKRLHVVEDLVRASGAAHLVLGLCSERGSTARLQAHARRAGLDPLSVEVLELGAWAASVRPQGRATAQAVVLLSAAVRRAMAFPGSQPANVKPYLPPRLSRRALFTLSSLEYRGVPSVWTRRCVAQRGCRLCVEACPRKALDVEGGRVVLDKMACDGCGLCVSACPREALAFPGYAPAQLAAQVEVLLDPTLTDLWPRGILFVCRNSAASLAKQAQREGGVPAGWLPVTLPCLGMVLPAWILACLARGAHAVALAPCPGRCPFAQDKTIAGRAAYVQELLHHLGDLPDRVSVVKALSELPPLPETAPHPETVSSSLPVVPVTPATSAQVHVHLGQVAGTLSDIAFSHPHAPFGLIRVTDGCTGCGVCAAACPSEALVLEHANGRLRLSFEAALCTACAQCLPACPEKAQGVLELERATNLERLAAGRVVLHEDHEWRCESCGAPIAPARMLQRIEALLGDEHAATLGVITRYCPQCRL